MRYVIAVIAYLIVIAGSIPLGFLTIAFMIPENLGTQTIPLTLVSGLSWFLGLSAYVNGTALFLKKNWGRIGAVVTCVGVSLLFSWITLIDGFRNRMADFIVIGLAALLAVILLSKPVKKETLT